MIFLYKYVRNILCLFMTSHTIDNFSHYPYCNIYDFLFTYGNDNETEENVFPSNLTHLIIHDDYNKEIKPNVLPNSLTQLIFGLNYNKEIKANVLPNNITHLIFGDNYNRIIKPNILPNNLTHLFFGHGYNKPIIKNVLPPSLTHLIFGNNFNKSIKTNVLPDNLSYISFGYNFRKIIDDNVYPKNLYEISIWSNAKIKNNLPASVRILNINFTEFYRYNEDIDTIPVTIEKIRIENSGKLYWMNFSLPLGCTITDFEDKPINFTNVDNGNLSFEYLKQLKAQK